MLAKNNCVLVEKVSFQVPFDCCFKCSWIKLLLVATSNDEKCYTGADSGFSEGGGGTS